MTDCRNCRRDTDLYLCTLCAKELHALLADLPWLLEQLQITVVRQDKLATGAVGRSSDNPSPINVGAMELARNLHGQLGTTCRELADAGSWALPPDDTPAMARWLYGKARWIGHTAGAGDTMREIRAATEAILSTINRVNRMWCGPCTTVTSHGPDGKPIECGHDLYGDRDTLEDIVCPRCKMTVSPRKHLLETLKRGDLLPEAKLLEILDSLDEHVSRVRLYDWIRTGALRPRGYWHQNRIVADRIRRGDPRVFSLSQARQLRRRDNQEAA